MNDQAIILHKTNRSTAVATLHDIVNSQLSEGKELDIPSLLTFISGFQNRSAECIFLPENVLINNEKSLVWYTKSKVSNMFFKKGGSGTRLQVPYPALLWSVDLINKQLHLFSLDSDVRPTLNSPIFHAPLANISSKGLVCQGTAKIPSQMNLSTLEAVEATIYDSAFTHINSPKTLSNKQGDTTANHIKFWEKLNKKQAKEFPLDCLNPFGKLLDII